MTDILFSTDLIWENHDIEKAEVRIRFVGVMALTSFIIIVVFLTMIIAFKNQSYFVYLLINNFLSNGGCTRFEVEHISCNLLSLIRT